MVTGFDIWGHDPNLRRHWKSRALAFLMDAAVAFVPTSLVLYFLGITNILEVGIIASTVFYLASGVPESLTGASLGKKVFGLRVHPVKGETLAWRVCIRNITRLLWFVLPPLDFALGMATRGDPRQRLLDRAAGTKVVHREESRRHQEHLKALSVPSPEIEPKDEPVAEDRCRDCGGKLLLLPGQNLQCEKCGLIQ